MPRRPAQRTTIPRWADSTTPAPRDGAPASVCRAVGQPAGCTGGCGSSCGGASDGGTCGAVAGELPEVGVLSILCDGAGKPRALVQVSDVTLSGDDVVESFTVVYSA